MAVEELEEIEEAVNVVPLIKSNARAFTVKKLDVIINWFNEQKHLISLVDMYINTASDQELYSLLITLTTKIVGYDHHGQPLTETMPISYPKGFNREFALGVIDKLKIDNPKLIADYGIGLLQAWARDSMDIGFIVHDGELFGGFMLIEDEPGYSAFLQLILKGSRIEQTKAALAFLKLWHNGYLRHWYDKGFRFICATAFTQKGKDFINRAGAKEDKHVFFSGQANQPVRYNGAYPMKMDARWDLKKKFQGKKSNEFFKQQ